jgi:hypothetical protein
VSPAVWATIAITLILAAAASFGALRGGRRLGSTTVMALFMLAAVLSIVAILSVTFFRKVTSA